MEAVEQDNPALKGVLPKDYPRPALDEMRLDQPIDLISNIPVGNADARSRNVLDKNLKMGYNKKGNADARCRNAFSRV